MKKVEVKSQITSSPQNVIEAFLDATMMHKWWGVEKCLVEKKTGGVYTLVWNINEQGFSYVTSGIIERLEPNSELVISKLVYLNPEKAILGPMTLTIKATIVDAETSEIYLCQDGYQSGGDWDWYFEAVKGTWSNVIDNLRKHLENL